jgi:Ca-activated chloride channel homolog
VDPETSTEGAATLGTLETVLGGEPGQAPPEDLVRSFVGLSRGVLPSVEDALALVSSDPDAPVVPTTEQSIVSHTGADGTRIVPVYPSQGTSILDYPVLRLNRPDEPDGIAEAAQTVAESLLSEQGTVAAQQAGFRSADGRLGTTRRQACPPSHRRTCPA